jgi:hypothetical protein
MDLVYTVSKDVHDHVELRYSIRSMYKYLQKFEKTFIVGECPSFLKDVIHIPAEDGHKNNSARNIYEKILKACDHPDLSDHFFYCADDCFLLKPLKFKKYPYFRSGDLPSLIQLLSKTSLYKPYVISTYNVLCSRNLPTLNFDIHLPIVYNKHIYKEIMAGYNWNVTKGYTSKTLYCNSLKIPGTIMKDVKLHTPKTKTAIYRKITGEVFFSTHIHSINHYLLEVFKELYPDPSPIEI